MPNHVHLIRQAVATLMACGLLASLLPGLAAAQGGAAKQPFTGRTEAVPYVILEDDYDSDSDGPAALCMLLELEAAGECQIIACGTCELHEDSTATMAATLHYFGRGDIPLGSYRDDLRPYDPETTPLYDSAARYVKFNGNSSTASYNVQVRDFGLKDIRVRARVMVTHPDGYVGLCVRSDAGVNALGLNLRIQPGVRGLRLYDNDQPLPHTPFQEPAHEFALNTWYTLDLQVNGDRLIGRLCSDENGRTVLEQIQVTLPSIGDRHYAGLIAQNKGERASWFQKGVRQSAEVSQTVLFEEDTDGFKLYRIPGIVVTAHCTVLAYCEARKFSGADRGEIEIHLRRSTDGGEIAIPQGGEPNIAQLSDGSVIVTARNTDAKNRRIFATSPDGATNWTRPAFFDEILEPGCMGSVVVRPGDVKKGTGPWLLYSGPYTTSRSHQDRRDVTIYASQDDGQTWPIRKRLHHGPSAYSDLAVLPDGQILCFYEQGVEKRFGDRGRPWAYRYLTLARFDLAWLLKPEEPSQD